MVFLVQVNELLKHSFSLECNNIKWKNPDVCHVSHVGVSTNAGDNHFFSLFLARLYTFSSPTFLFLGQAVNKRTKQVFRFDVAQDVTTGKIKGAQY